MKKTPCLCDHRKDIRCDETHCDLAGPGKPGDPNECRVCWLRLHRYPPGTEIREVGDSERKTPCVFLGEVLDQQGCVCPARWLRICAIHKVCNLSQCKTCPDYEEM